MTIQRMIDLCRDAEKRVASGQAGMVVPVEDVVSLVRECLGLMKSAIETIDERNDSRDRSQELHVTLAQLVKFITDADLHMGDAAFSVAIEVAQRVLAKEEVGSA